MVVGSNPTRSTSFLNGILLRLTISIQSLFNAESHSIKMPYSLTHSLSDDELDNPDDHFDNLKKKK